ncbi:MAG: sodium/proline symporter [Sandaracinaceae bacterium]|nr:sodium/proline symporter [Sandaracinaceae bacterium]
MDRQISSPTTRSVGGSQWGAVRGLPLAGEKSPEAIDRQISSPSPTLRLRCRAPSCSNGPHVVIKLVAVVLYLAVLLGIGVVASRRVKDVRDYFAAGKGLGYWAVAFSARATGESAWLLIGLTGMGAAVGAKAFWVVLGEVLGVATAWLVLCRRFKRLSDRYDSITVPDYLEDRFGDTRQILRIVSAAALVVFVTIYVSAQIDATGKAFESFLGWDYYVGIAVGFAVVIVYSVAGGFLAVAWSDVFQGALMFLGLVGLPVVALVVLGGPGAMSARLEAIDPGLLSLAGPDGWSVATALSVASLTLIGLGFLGSPQIFVRYIALRDEAEIPKGALVAIVFTVLADAGAVLIGMSGRALLTSPGEALASTALGESGEAVLPLAVEHLLPALLVGLFVAIVLSAIMSTVDSLLVLAGSALVRDFYQKVRRPDLPDDQLVSKSRLATFGLAIAALAIALGVAITTPDRTVFWFVIFGWSGISATFCPTMILSLYFRRMTARGAVAAMATGFVCVPLFKFLAPSLPVVGDTFATLGELPPAFLGSFVAGVAVSLLDPRRHDRAAAFARDLQDRVETP